MSAIKERRKSQHRVVVIDGNFVLERPLVLSATKRIGPIGRNTIAWIPPSPESLLASSTKSHAHVVSANQRKPSTTDCAASSPAPTEYLAASWQRENHTTMSWAHPGGESEDLAASTAPTTHTRSVEKTVSWSAIGSNADEQSAGLTHVNTATFTNATKTLGTSLGNSLMISGSSSFGTGGGGAIANFLSMSLMQTSVMGNVANSNGVTASGLGYFTYHDEIEARSMPVKAFVGRDCSSNERVVVWMQQLPRTHSSSKHHHKQRGDTSPQSDATLQGRGLPPSQKFGTTRGILHVMGTHIQALLRQKVLDVSEESGETSTSAADAASEPTRYIPGIPRLLYFDTEGDTRFQCLVQPALGPTLLSLIRYCGGRLTLRSVLMLGIQLLELLKHCAGCSSRGVEGGSAGGISGVGMTLNDISPSTLRFGASSVDQHVLYMTSFAHCAAVGSNGRLPPLASVKPAPTSPNPASKPPSASLQRPQQTVTIPAATAVYAATDGNPMSPGLLGSSLLPPPTLVVDDASGVSGQSMVALFAADPLNISAVSHNSQFAVSQNSKSPSHALSMLGSSFVSTVTTENCRLAREHNLAFGSARFHLGMPLSLADDAESVAYVLVYCLTGSLPWLSNHLLLEGEEHDDHQKSSSTAHYVANAAVMAQLTKDAEFLAAHPQHPQQQQATLPPALSSSIRSQQRATVPPSTPSASDLFARHLFRMKEQFTSLNNASSRLPTPLVHLLSTTQLLAKAASQEVNPVNAHTSPGRPATHLNPPRAASAAGNMSTASSNTSLSTATLIATLTTTRDRPSSVGGGAGQESGTLSTADLLQDTITTFRMYYAKAYGKDALDYVYDWNQNA
jgi:hypothetical protein